MPLGCSTLQGPERSIPDAPWMPLGCSTLQGPERSIPDAILIESQHIEFTIKIESYPYIWGITLYMGYHIPHIGVSFNINCNIA